MNQRLALLSAVLAAPDDDLPRLVFADWLEESGTTDADAARVEFIRLGCKSKAKTRFSSVEGRWLDANWRRLLGTILSTPSWHDSGSGSRTVFHRRSGRYLSVCNFQYTEVIFEYSRGFARRVEYCHPSNYRQHSRASTTDEPVAYHAPKLNRGELMPQPTGRVMLLRESWGNAIYSRAGGYDSELSLAEYWEGRAPHGLGEERVKVYLDTPSPDAPVPTFHPLATLDAGDLDTARARLWAAVATAMTAIAREFVGLAEPQAGGAT